MAKNNKQTSKGVASTAGKVLRDAKASSTQKGLAVSALAEAAAGKQTGKEMEGKASRALTDKRSSETTKGLAASLVSQSNEKR